MIEWFSRNHVAANLLMFGIMLMGIVAVKKEIPLEFLPDFQLGVVNITTVLPGGNPQTIESTITSRIEESIADIEGIKSINSRSIEGLSSVFVEIESGYNDLNILSDVKNRVDGLNTLPADAERPIIELAEQIVQVVGIVAYGEVEYDLLFDTISNMREELLQIPGITSVSPIQAPAREISIEVEPETLKKYDLSIADLAQAIQNNAVDISAGNLRTDDGDILLRTNAQAYVKADFEAIPIVNSGDRVLYLRDVASVVDGYQLIKVESLYNGLPAISFEAYRVGQQSTIEVADKVLEFMREYRKKLPEGISLGNYGNTAEVVESRLSTLIASAIQGGLLVLILLSLFLRPAVAFWVGLGIPVCFLGGLALMPYLGLSLNMFTMFAFLLVLGIVVDDAIVTGENIYRHQRNGMSPAKAALFGTKEVAIPVTFGVITTMVAFVPMLLVEGPIANIAKQIPLIVIPVLAFSLIESKLILPAHMSSVKPRNESNMGTLAQLQQRFSRGFENAIIELYRPFLNKCIRNKLITLSTAICVFIVTIFSVGQGWLKVSFFPDFEDNLIVVNLSMPSNTGYDTTRGHVLDITNIANKLAESEEYTNPETGESYVRYIISTSGVSVSQTGLSFGNHLGIIFLEFVQGKNGLPPNISLTKTREKLRQQIGEIAGAEQLSISSSFADFGKPLSVSVYGKDTQRLGVVTEKIREYLKSYPGVFDIQDTLSAKKEELQLDLKPLANSLGLSQNNIATQVREALFGFEAQRIQRGYDDIKVMVRYPLNARSSINDVKNIPIRTPRSTDTIPLFELAQLQSIQAPSTVYREDSRRLVTINADVDLSTYEIEPIRDDFDKFLKDLFNYESQIDYQLSGQAETQLDTIKSFVLGFVLIIAIIYALLAIPFKSFGQPLVVMSIIPLAIVGAIVGHYVMGLAFSMLSIMGILGLTGIVVNDSLVLVDYINKKRSEGMVLMDAVLTAGETRFRPVILTSLTTFVGLLPLMLNGNSHAQALIPMSVSLGFGIIFATIITLVITPVCYLAGRQTKHFILSINRELIVWFNQTGVVSRNS